MSKMKNKIRTKEEIPTDETKEARFVRVCTPRVKRAIASIRMVKQTITGNNYAMTEAQIQTIVSKLVEEVNGISQAFSGRNRSKKDIEVTL